MKFVKVSDSSELQAIFTPDKWTGNIEYINGIQTEVFACTKPLILNINETLNTTENWFITKRNNELIYDIDKNNWINLSMFDIGHSCCTEIYYATTGE